jgi:hypothetical protein
VTLADVCEKVNVANSREDWREVLKWEGRMEEMMEDQPDDFCNTVLAVFCDAHGWASRSTGSRDHSLSIVRLQTRHAEVLGKMQRFRDQGAALCTAADYLRFLGKKQEAQGYLQRARKIAEAHGFFAVECNACLGLGKLAMDGGLLEEGVELLRNAMVCVPLCEGDYSTLELEVIQRFTDALLLTHAIDEVEPLFLRYREAAKVESEKQGRLHFWDFHSLVASARLHEVLCSCPPRWELPHIARPLHFTKADSVSHRY